MKPKQIIPTLVPEALQEFLLKESDSKEQLTPYEVTIWKNKNDKNPYKMCVNAENGKHARNYVVQKFIQEHRKKPFDILVMQVAKSSNTKKYPVVDPFN